MLRAEEYQKNKVSIICEIASAHSGNIDILKKLLLAANDANSDWVKIQIFQFDSLVAGENSKFGELKQIELTPLEWIKAINFSKNLKPKLIAEVFDFPSFQLVKNEPTVKAFKIPTADLGDKTFVDAICQVGKPIFIGVGGASMKEIDAIFDQVSVHGVDITLLHGIQNFPTRLEDSLLKKIQLLRQRYDCNVGFADHIDAEDSEMAKILPAMAVAAGATVIEKHINMNRSKKDFDYYSSLNPDEFKSFVKLIKKISTAVGGAKLSELTHAEQSYRDKMKKFAVLFVDVKKGDIVNDANIQYRRTSSPGITRMEFNELGKKVFALNLTKGVVLSEECFE